MMGSQEYIITPVGRHRIYWAVCLQHNKW